MIRARQLASCIKAFESEVPIFDIPTLRAHWADPAPFDADTAANRARANATIDRAVQARHPHLRAAAQTHFIEGI